jgi:YidC/Oxa1 family membrane protein insertase
LTAPAAAPARRGNFGPLLIIAAAAIGIFVVLASGGNPWDMLFINPLINALILLNIVVMGQFGLAILLFTFLLRIATIPFTIRQLESTRAMQTMQPQMQELQKKYKDPKRRQEETLKLYREHNINPLGCFMPMLIQMVVFIALYRALVFTVGGSPESLIGLSQRLYPISFLQNQVPLQQHFLWLNLGQADTTFIVPIIVGLSTYVQQRLSITPNASPQQQQQQQMMTWMMPMMLMFFTLNLPSGVGVYWVASNVFSLGASYYVYGKRVLSWRQLLPGGAAPAPVPAARRQEPEDGEEGPAAGTPVTSPTPRGGGEAGAARVVRKRRRRRR